MKRGRDRTISISICILLVSLFTIYFYHIAIPDAGLKHLLRQGIRFLLTVGLLVAIYKGKEWARVIAIALFSVTLIWGAFSILTLEVSIISRIPLMVFVVVYSLSVYHFGFSKSFKAFFKNQQ